MIGQDGSGKGNRNAEEKFIYNMYEIETAYDRKAMKALARAVRKTVRKRWDIISKIIGSVALVMAVFVTALYLIFDDLGFDFDNIIILIAGIFILACMIWQDDFNAWIGKARTYQAGATAKQIFQDDKYIIITPGVTGEWEYHTIQWFCETRDYFMFILDKNHGQIMDKSGFQQGAPDDFREFIEKKAGLKAIYIK